MGLFQYLQLVFFSGLIPVWETNCLHHIHCKVSLGTPPIWSAGSIPSITYHIPVMPWCPEKNCQSTTGEKKLIQLDKSKQKSQVLPVNLLPLPVLIVASVKYSLFLGVAEDGTPKCPCGCVLKWILYYIYIHPNRQFFTGSHDQQYYIIIHI